MATAPQPGPPARDPAPSRGHELTLVAAAQDGDELAFQRLLRHHRTLLEAHAARFYLPGADHDDVLQEARIAFANAVRGFRPDAGASFRTFAALCITRRLASAVPAAQRNKHMALSSALHGEEAEHAWASVPATAGDPRARALAAERRHELASATTSLSALERQLLGHALLGWSSAQTARRLGLAAKTADNALQRARRKVAAWHERQAA